MIDDYKLNTYEDADVLQHIIYNTKAAMYQITLCVKKACLAHKTIHHAADNPYIFTVTLETVQDEFIQNYDATKKTSTPGKTQPVLCCN
jgi:hypothetical protein